MRRRPSSLLFLLTMLSGAPATQAIEIKIVNVGFSNLAPIPAFPTVQTTEMSLEAFQGNYLIIPVTAVSSNPSKAISAQNFRVLFVYRVIDQNGVAGPQRSVPVGFEQRGSTLVGAVIEDPRTLFGSAQVVGGQLIQYYWQVVQGTRTNAIKPSSGLSFETSVITEKSYPVDPAGTSIQLPSLNMAAGKTTITLPAGAVTSPSTLVVQQLPASGLPPGPNGTQPVNGTAWSFSINSSDKIRGTAKLVISYPTEPSTGKVLVGQEAVFANGMGVYQLDESADPAHPGSYGWRPVGRASIDKTLSVLTVTTPSLGKFAIFPVAVKTSDLRPLERIITPNGDGINDRAIFSGLTSADEVKIFDIRGRRVRSIHGPDAYWDGTEEDGRIAESGIYIYQYTSQGDRVSGVISVAK